MSLKIFNSLTRKKDEFITVEKKKVKMYVCGMTVYSDAHIGHARTYFAFDVIRRYLEYKDYKVIYIQNITDVDDKIIEAAKREGVEALDYSRKFTNRCLDDLDNLGIRRADIYPKASDTIPDMIEMIQKIIQKGYGYEVNGDVYFSVKKFKDYGKLSGQKLDDLLSGVRIESDDKKYSPLDFALWKKAKAGEPAWNSPWGMGRPGWHIECSTMSSKHLGLPFDIHGGGMDLRFPHHENEIAQAETATGKLFSRYWIHVGLLTVNGEKMSKSIGNIVNIKDLLKKWDPEVVRFFFAQTHYRSPPDFSEKALKNAEKGLNRIHRLRERLKKLSNDACVNIDESKFLSKDDKDYYKIICDFKYNFDQVMDDDFNTPGAVAILFDFVNKSNSYFKNTSNPNIDLCKYALNNFEIIGGVLTLFQPKSVLNDLNDDLLFEKLKKILFQYEQNVKEKSIDELIDKILTIRQNARNKKDWNISDKIRNDLEEIGFEIQDTNVGTTWRKK